MYTHTVDDNKKLSFRYRTTIVIRNGAYKMYGNAT